MAVAISVITPVYNPPLHLLEECIRTVLGQTCEDFEWILVDDGSKREIAVRLDGIAEQDSRARVLHCENGGASEARNRGLAVAKGDYVTFVDSDDAIPKYFFAEALKVARDTDADMVSGRVRYLRENGVIEHRFYDRPHVVEFEGSDLESLKRLMLTRVAVDKATEGLGGFAPYTIYPKFYRREIVEGVRFDPRMSIGEDSLFSLLAVEQAHKVALVDETWYDYADNAQSVTHAHDLDVLSKQLDGLLVYEEQRVEHGWSASDVGMRYFQSFVNVITENARSKTLNQMRVLVTQLLALDSSKMLDHIDASQYHLTRKRRAILQAVLIGSPILVATLVKLRVTMPQRTRKNVMSPSQMAATVDTVIGTAKAAADAEARAIALTPSTMVGELPYETMPEGDAELIPEISVITPVYNPPLDMLRSCIESVRTQTFPDFEWIVVDDGSSPDVAQILDEVALDDARVRVIHSENFGASVARNRGLEESRGAYVTFVDSDDQISPRFFAEALEVAHETDADLVAGRVRYLRETGIIENHFEGHDRVVVFEGTGLTSLRRLLLTRVPVDDATSGLGGFGPYTICPKLYRRKLVEEVRFDPRMLIGEDSLFGLLAVDGAERVVLVDEGWYDYVDNAFSTTHAHDVDVLCTQLNGLLVYVEKMGEHGWLPSDVGMRYFQSFVNVITENARVRSFRETSLLVKRLLSLESAGMLDWIDKNEYRLTHKRRAILIAVLARSGPLVALLVKLRGSVRIPNNAVKGPAS